MPIVPALKTLTIAAVLACCTHGAIGQVTTSLPGSIVQSASLNSSAQQQIQDYVASLSGKVTSDNLRDATRAREQLLKPLADRDVSVAFRQAYAQSLMGLMTDLDSSEEFGNKLLALRLAGELATSESIQIIDTHMSDADPALRVFAIGRVQRVFEITAARGLGIAASEATALVNALAEQAESEDDMLVVESIVRALAAGSTLPSRDLSEARNQSIQALATVVSPILRELNPTDPTEDAYRLALRAASAMTASINDINATIAPESITQAVGLAGDILSVPLRRIFANTTFTDADRDLTARAVQSAEALLYFARRKHSLSNSVAQTAFAEMISAKEDRDYRDSVSQLLGPNSQIVRTFGFDPNRFLRD